MPLACTGGRRTSHSSIPSSHHQPHSQPSGAVPRLSRLHFPGAAPIYPRCLPLLPPLVSGALFALPAQPTVCACAVMRSPLAMARYRQSMAGATGGSPAGRGGGGGRSGAVKEKPASRLAVPPVGSKAAATFAAFTRASPRTPTPSPPLLLFLLLLAPWLLLLLPMPLWQLSLLWMGLSGAAVLLLLTALAAGGETPCKGRGSVGTAGGELQ